jgi:hypothetical protein
MTPCDLAYLLSLIARQLSIVSLVLFANEFSALIIFPFLPFMIHDFFPSTPLDQLGMSFTRCLEPHSSPFAGMYAGLLASAFNVGQFCGSTTVPPSDNLASSHDRSGGDSPTSTEGVQRCLLESSVPSSPF